MISKKQFEKELDIIISNAVREDVGGGDYSSLACIPEDTIGKAKLLVKEDGIIAGVEFAKRIFNYVDVTLKVETLINDGEKVKYGDIVFYVSGSSQSILKSERLVLNVMQRMSAIATKTKEFAVRDYINANFEGFQHDKIMTTSHCDCSIKRRIDHRYLINNTLLVVETDENQHRSYDAMDEEIRYDDLYMAFSGKWIYIRFNPDKYISNKGIRKNPTIASRLPILKEEIERQISRIKNNENTELLERIYMYYDKYD
jgi:hypothetical protein